MFETWTIHVPRIPCSVWIAFSFHSSKRHDWKKKICWLKGKNCYWRSNEKTKSDFVKRKNTPWTRRKIAIGLAWMQGIYFLWSIDFVPKVCLPNWLVKFGCLRCGAHFFHQTPMLKYLWLPISFWLIQSVLHLLSHTQYYYELQLSIGNK